MKRNNNGLTVALRFPRKQVALSLFLILSMLLVLLVMTVGPADAQENKARITITDLADVDDDFHLMGEFQGMVRSANGSHCPVGLQVVALGDGEFSGMHYECGLPGTGWNKEDRTELTGKRDGDMLILEGDGVRYEVTKEGATSTDEAGLSAGTLKKVHRVSPTMGMRAPANAYTLFDGTDTNVFKDGKMTDDGLLIEGTELIPRFRDFTLHAEYRLPYMPFARGQARSNSGFYLQSSYEVQVLDSFGLEGIENECGALYRYKRPDQNMCLPPLQWQTYDLTFRSPRFDSDGNKIQNARITVLHNGVAVHDDFEIERKTGAGKKETPVLHPIKFQDHSNPVRFRNMWLIDLEHPVPVHATATACPIVCEPVMASFPVPPPPAMAEAVATPATTVPATPVPLGVSAVATQGDHDHVHNDHDHANDNHDHHGEAEHVHDDSDHHDADHHDAADHEDHGEQDHGEQAAEAEHGDEPADGDSQVTNEDSQPSASDSVVEPLPVPTPAPDV